MSILLTICDDDAASRAVFEKALASLGLSGVCRVSSVSDYSRKHGALLWVGQRGQPVPEYLSLPEERIFYKPVRLGRVLDQVIKIVKNEEKTNNKSIIGGRFVFDGHNLIIFDQKLRKEVRLTEKEHLILQILLKNEDSIVPKRQLLDEVWGYNEHIETHTLETHIYRLRQKIEDDPSQPVLLLTDEQGGYRLKA